MLRRCGAEFLGMFAYVFLGCGTRILLENPEHLLLVHLTFGFTLFIMTYSLGHISGAPLNPAVIFGLAVARRFPWRFVWLYWLAQVGGALAASCVHFLLIPLQSAHALFGATVPQVGIVQAIAIEALLDFFLMIVVLAALTDTRVSRAVPGLSIGLTITVGGLFADSLTGGSMNPARSLAPALLVGGQALATVWVYWLGPLLGTTCGALIYEALRGGEVYARRLLEQDQPQGDEREP